jgi:two-component SAPR family response regulator
VKAIAVDDEIYMLEALSEAISASDDIESVRSFSSCSGALAYVEENPVDIAFLDINMRGIGGLRLAELINEKQQKCRIVFCTGYEQYAVSAFRLHASGYLMKPITAADVQKEIDHVKNVQNTQKLLTVKCFGNFEVFYNGDILPFKRTKTKEVLAVLVDRSGAGMTAKQMCAILFADGTDDAKNVAYIRQLIFDLKNTLKNIGADSVLRHETPYYRVDPERLRCDYFSYLETGSPEFRGEYMKQYSWAEETCAMLHFKK